MLLNCELKWTIADVYIIYTYMSAYSMQPATFCHFEIVLHFTRDNDLHDNNNKEK